jgi:CO/xanthine dehydrogenase FAD-binding subunit
MKPAPFRYVPVGTIAQALELKAQHGDEARFLAGGQSLVPAMNFRLIQPAVVIDVNPIAELSGISRTESGHLVIGALTRYRTIERDRACQHDLPLVAEALPHIAHPQIRNRGTIGGNLAHADPASEMPAIVVALAGRLRVQSVKGERWIGASDFFRGALSTALEPDEILAAVELPVATARSGFCFLEVARRRGDFAIAGVACMIEVDDRARCVSARISLCNAADRPILRHKVLRSLSAMQLARPR